MQPLGIWLLHLMHSSYLAGALSKGGFTAKKREVIALASSGLSDSNYGLAAHTWTALKYGCILDEVLSVRRRDIADEKIAALAQVVRSTTEK